MYIIWIALCIVLLGLVAIIREKLYIRKHKQELNLKPRFWVLLVLRVLALTLTVAIGVLIYKADFKPSEIVTYENGNYQVTVYQIGAPAFPFGPGKCRIVLRENGKLIAREDLELHNDGKWPYEDNFSVSWQPDRVTVTAKGEEQEDTDYILPF